jgi:hypothetical protein
MKVLWWVLSMAGLISADINLFNQELQKIETEKCALEESLHEERAKQVPPLAMESKGSGTDLVPTPKDVISDPHPDDSALDSMDYSCRSNLVVTLPQRTDNSAIQSPPE